MAKEKTALALFIEDLKTKDMSIFNEYHLERYFALEKTQIEQSFVMGWRSDCLMEQSVEDFSKHYFNEQYKQDENK